MPTNVRADYIVHDSRVNVLTLEVLVQEAAWYTCLIFPIHLINVLMDMTMSLHNYIMLFLQFFNDSLVLGKETDSCMEKHIYELILELNRISNTILLSVLPQLEFKLKVSKHDLQSTLREDL